MKKLKISTKNQNRILVLFAGIIFMIILSGLFDIYYDMNDDVVMKNILCGAYKGTPDGHNVQMLYPLAFLISLCYRMFPALPWYGYFLFGCFFLSYFLLGTRLVSYLKVRVSKIIAVILLLLFYFGLSLYELVYIQYTVVSGILTLTAAVLFITTPENITAKEFLKTNIGTILLLFIAYNLRTEMLLFLSPFLAIAGIICWSHEKSILSKNSFAKYFLFIGILIAGMGLSEAGNRIAYNNNEWQIFNHFFNARTEVYDYTWYPNYDTNKDFYDNIGISNAQYHLIDNYNFGLDKRIDADVLDKIADYQHNLVKQSDVSLLYKMKSVLSSYCYRLHNYHFTWNETSDMPYNVIIIMLYLIMILQAISKRDKSLFYKLPVMIILRSIPWIYIIYRGRIVTRLTHPMYLIETGILIFALLIEYFKYSKGEQLKKNNRFCQIVTYLCITFIICILLISSVMQFQNVRNQQEIRKDINISNNNLMKYTRQHPGNFYYLDVYTSVAFSEKMFKNVDNHLQNYDILGGWISKSPISRSKEKYFGICNVQNDMISLPSLYFIAEENSDLNWILQYYQELGETVVTKEIDKIDGGKESMPLIVYKVEKLE